MSFEPERVAHVTVEEASTRLDEKGVHRPIKDGLEQDASST